MTKATMLQWDAMMNLLWNTNTYSDVASLALAGSEDKDNLKMFAGNLVTSQIIVGDLRKKRMRPEAGLEVAGTIAGKGPLTVSPHCDIFICANMMDTDILVYRSNSGTGWREVAKLKHHTDQISGLAISPDSKRLAACGWDGVVSIWSLGLYSQVFMFSALNILLSFTFLKQSETIQVKSFKFLLNQQSL